MTFHWVGKSADGKTVTLHKLHQGMFTFPDYGTSDWISSNTNLIHTGAAIDIETTGLDQSKDKIIELGLRLFKYNSESGEILSLDTAFSSFADPGMPLSEEVKKITGIDDAMLVGQAIDWDKVHSLLSDVRIIIAHNAAFDRPFIDNYFPPSKNILWGCSLQQVDWKAHGFTSKSLETLSVYHGFFTDAHRALNDSDALVYLLSLRNNSSQAPYLSELLKNAVKPVMLVYASYTAYEKKDLLKSKQYRWDGNNKVWYKLVDMDLHEAEIAWLEKTVYEGKFRGKTSEIKAIDRFKLFLPD